MPNQVLHILIPHDVNGLKIVELANWTGKCILAPRTSLKDLKSRPEALDPGVYFLFGEPDESTNQNLYIGESEEFYNRLANHDASKDFWNTAVIFTGGLDKAKIKYLEYLATSSAAKAARYFLKNSVIPAENALSEFDLVAVREYFEKIKFILSAVGFPVFENVKESLSDKAAYFIKKDGSDAKGQLLDDGSINVLKGSLARIRETESFGGWALAARRQFLEDGTLKELGDGVAYIFTKDVLFKSPSAAAATITGRSTNGWTAWKDEDGNTLDENLRK